MYAYAMESETRGVKVDFLDAIVFLNMTHFVEMDYHDRKRR
jgi:hypothetical protein